jgi:twinkle protein
MTTIDEGFVLIGVEIKNSGIEQKVKCPECKRQGKKNWRDTSLSINRSNGLFNCHKCGFKGCVAPYEKKAYEMNVTYKLPEKKNMTALSDEALKYFQSRCINQEVVKANKIVMTKDGSGIVFPYLREGKLVNYKTRLLKEKRFFQAKEAEPIMYNLDRIAGQNEIIVCEGEFDSLSWEVAGHANHTTVNQGAPNETDTNVDKKLECITNCFDVFERAVTIYIAVDGDVNGIRLQHELIRRFGAEKCKLVNFGDCKDANEYLIKHGAFELSGLLAKATDVKIDGIFTVSDNAASMWESFNNGHKRGESTHVDEINTAWKWRKGEVTLWTGYQNEGKSLMLNQLSLLKSYFDGDRYAVFSPENMPFDDFYNDLIEMFIGKTSDAFYKSAQMTQDEYREAMEFLQSRFFLIYPEEDFKLDSIFEKTKYLIRKHGIDHLIIDPYNTIEHMQKAGEREDLYISRFMSQLKRFAVEKDISIQLVAHQLTARKNKEDGGRYFKPDLNNIKGGGTFADKADNVVYVWRPNRAVDFRDPDVIFASQKIKKQKLVARPCEIDSIRFEFKENRYYFGDYCPFHLIDKQRKESKEKVISLLQEVSPFQLAEKTATDAFGEPYKEMDELPF